MLDSSFTAGILLIAYSLEGRLYLSLVKDSSR